MGKKLFNSGIAGFIGLLVLSVVFYKERIIFSDAAFYLFNIVKDGNFVFFHSRYIAAITELFPLAAVKMNLSLANVAIAYSTGFVAFYFIAYLACGLAFKNYQLALVILIVNLLFITDAFYWMLSELMQGMVLMIVFFSMLNTTPFAKIGLRSLIACLVFIPVLVWSHPLLFIPFSFCVFFLMMSERKVSSKVLWMAIAIFIAITVIQKVFFSDGYDSHAAGGVKNFITLFPDYFSQYSQKLFLENCLKKYFWIPILSIPTLVFYARHKYWKKFWLFLTYLAGYIMLINVSYPNADTQVFYFENLYTPLGVIIGLPVVFDIFPVLQRRKLSMALLAAIMLSGLIRIWYYNDPYTARVAWLRNYVQQHKYEKILVHQPKVPSDTLMMIWGTPYETWLLSTIEHGQTASIIISEDPWSLEWGTHSGNSWLSTWGQFPYAELPKNYFIFKDSMSTYKIVN